MKPVNRRRRRSEINIVPLIDVLTILVFFFLVTMQYRDLTALNLVLPRIETAGTSERARFLTIGIDASGNYSLDGQTINRDDLPGLLLPLREVGRDVAVLIMADENTPIREITHVMDQSRLAGLENIRLQSR